MGAIARTLWAIVRFYRMTLAYWLGGNCRFEPSCSVFAEQALQQLPVTSAVAAIGKRLACCHPWHPGGYDPVQTDASRSRAPHEAL